MVSRIVRRLQGITTTPEEDRRNSRHNRIKSTLQEIFRSSVNITISVSIAVGIAVTVIHNSGILNNNQVPQTVSVSPMPASNSNTNTNGTSKSRWLPYLESWEQKYGVPVNVQWGVILNESGGKQFAETITRPIDGVNRYAKGLFQVVDHWDRFKPNEDPFDPDVNARVGLGYLIGCNRQVTNRLNMNWTDTEALRWTFACYHAGANGDWNTDDVQRYAENVLAIALRHNTNGNISSSNSYNSNSSSSSSNRTISIEVNSSGNDGNDCSWPSKICRTESDWKHGWCSYHTRNRTNRVTPGETVETCIQRGTRFEFDNSWGNHYQQ